MTSTWTRHFYGPVSRSHVTNVNSLYGLYATADVCLFVCLSEVPSLTKYFQNINLMHTGKQKGTVKQLSLPKTRWDVIRNAECRRKVPLDQPSQQTDKNTQTLLNRN